MKLVAQIALLPFLSVLVLILATAVVLLAAVAQRVLIFLGG